MMPSAVHRLPPAFDPDFYRVANPDLDLRDDADALRHYEAEGRRQGRIASAMATREALVAAIGAERPVLEIGPFCTPLLRGDHVRYLDMLDAPALRRRAAELGLDPSGCPERIHHVGGLDGVGEHFGDVLASHSIEHQPDLIRHLAEVAKVLEPTGRYWLIVPDKRFCFDHFLPETTIADVIDAFDEQREVHRLGSVVEHVALATHNDAHRHWLGDHGAIDPAGQAARVTEAIAAHRRSGGGYLDVHAWQFTPESFRHLFETLATLGLSAFDVERVYDTPRDRLEFCAVLRKARPSRIFAKAGQTEDVVFLQTADPFRYADMLAITAPSAIEYCRRHRFRYESFVGIKRGYWGWQASFNRIVMLAELVERGFRGWAVHLDADAYVNDIDFDLSSYLLEHSDRAAIFATSGVTGEAWDVNSGIGLVNLGHPEGRRLVELWHSGFKRIPEERLRGARDWFHDDDDQDLLHKILRSDAPIAAAVRVESTDVINSPHAQFIRQRLRAQFSDLDSRVRGIAAEVRDALKAARATLPPALAAVEARDRAQTLHVLPGAPWLSEAPPGPVEREAAARLIELWRTSEGPVSPHQTELAAMLDRGDADAVAAELAGFGRSAAAEGVLGGRRQHRRCARDPAFADRRARRTQDVLLSLAEVTGAIAVENPDHGPWGLAARIDARSLYASVAEALEIDLAPPPGIGAYLGIWVASDIVVHARMIEAIYAAWRVRQIADMLNIVTVGEIGGGIGLAAFYAARLGLPDWTLASGRVDRIVQRHVLGNACARTAATFATPVDLVFAEDLSSQVPVAEAVAHIDRARRQGARAMLLLDQEASPVADARFATPSELAARAGGWRRVGRSRHGIRPGYVEELYVAR